MQKHEWPARFGALALSGTQTILLVLGFSLTTLAHADAMSTLIAGGDCGSSSGAAYRSADGRCNNLQTGQGEWGASGSELLRMSAATYGADGHSMPGGLPAPRDVSNAVVAQPRLIPNANGVSAMLMQWGQFLDHDIGLTPAQQGESAPIAIAPDDPHFSGDMPFNRSIYAAGTGDSAANPRQQVNVNTAWIDGSQIYGSDAQTALALRTGANGTLKMSDGGLLHLDSTGHFVSGDERVNEQIGLTAMHTLFNREHNRIATELESSLRGNAVGGVAPGAPGYEAKLDEAIYQEARRINIAQLQAITYNEFLPALLGDGTITAWSGYRSDINPGIANEFSTAAFRFGHSTLNPELLRIDANGQAIAAGHLPLEQAFFNPDLLLDAENGGIEPLLRGLSVQRAQEVDTYVVDAVRNMLFAPPVDVGFDLAALNLQRGRDHGIGGYNASRVAYGLDPVDWDSAPFLPGIKEHLMTAYVDIDDLDLWIGGLGEQHVNGGLLGETFATIVSDQFTRLRDGDRFWYQNAQFEDLWLDAIDSSRLSTIIMRNTSIDAMQANAFFMVPEPGGAMTLLAGMIALAVSRRVRRR